MKSTPTFVSVLMPVYNTEPIYLNEAINSILKQTYPYFELLIYDDCSSREETLNELKIFSERDARVRVIYSQKNSGVSQARKKLIANAKYSLCANMDSDDIALPVRLERQVEFFSKHPDVGICGSWFRRIPSNETIMFPTIPKHFDFLQCDCLGNSTVMFNRDLYDKYGLEYNDTYSVCEDYELYSRALRNIKIVNIPEVLVEYRVRSDSLSHADIALVREKDRFVQNLILDSLTLQPKLRKDILLFINGNRRIKWRFKVIKILRKLYDLRVYFRLPVIVRLYGGLGNQMFQYAFGRALSISLGRRVKFDLSWFEEAKKTIINKSKKENAEGVVIREFALDKFMFKVPTVSRFQTALFRRLGGRVNEPVESYRKYDESLLYRKHIGVWDGYFQHEKYFKKIRPELESSFVFPAFKPTDTYNQNLLLDISLCDESVFVHVRMGDFVNLGWQLPCSYYINAAKYMAQRLKNPHFFVFGEYVPEIMNAIREYSSHVEWVGDQNAQNHEDWKDMSLMMACRNAIVANSTFSWWAAWLGNAKMGVVAAPTPYFDGSDDGVCENWTLIPR